MRKFKKRISVLLAVALMLGMFNSWSAYAGVLGDKLYGKSVVIGEEATLANGVYWNAGYTEKITENYIEYIPGGSVVPIISHGNDVHGAASFKAVASKAAMEGKTVVAGLNGDFFTMSNGVPDGVTIKDGLLITSESSGKPSVGFYPDGKIIIGRSNLNIRADGPNLGTGIGAIHLNKAVSKVSGVMLYTRDYGNDDTNKASIPTYNVLLRVDTEELHINGRVEAMVESVFSAVGPTTIPQGRVLLSLAAATEYPGTLTKLMALIPGDTLSLTFEGNSAWDNVNFAIGGGDRIVSGGKNVASASKDIHPRTAVGLKADGSAVFYTLDGRKAGHSKGATLSQLADRLIELGCTEAVNMDGGGSTAIHAVYPGDSDINTINSPSEGSLRNCANYILLVNTARPTGQLGNLHLYPYNPRMLAGATQKFTVKGSDTNYYPVGVYLPLSFDAPEDLGTFDNDGNFTAGKQGGKGEVMVFADGGVSGSTEVEIVTKPDSITILNQSDKKAVTNISINAGDKIDLTASSTYQRLPLHSSDRSYTWTVEGGIGTIDENGLFTASDVSSGSGTIKASAGGTVASVTVNIISDGWQLETFENSSHTFQSAGGSGVSFALNSDLTRVRYGYKSGKINYDFKGAGKNELLIPTSIKFARNPGSINFWVYGDNSGNTLNMIVKTSSGDKEVAGTKLNFSGWKMVVASMPQGASSLSSLKLVKSGNSSGTLYFDQFMAGLGNFADSEPPIIEMSRNNQVLTAVVKDAADSRLSESKIKLTFDGEPLEFSYNRDNKTLTANLPPLDGAMHRVVLVANDESGNIARKGLTIAKTHSQDQTFVDMEGHWAVDNTTYLYERGVVNGLETDEGLIYNPDKSITRAEFAVLMKNWLGKDAKGYENVKLPFVDTGAIPSWALDSVKAMYGMGIIMGTGTDKGLVFNPTGPISRQEVMTIIGRTQIKGFGESDLSGFTDRGHISVWALPYVRTLVKQQVVSGSGSRLWPGNSITRAEVATIITNLY